MKSIALCLCLLALTSCSDTPVTKTIEHAHVIGCGKWGIDVITAGNSKLEHIEWAITSGPPFCGSWNSATWWTIIVKSDNEKDYYFQSAEVSK